jgi:hypothetical protein
MLGDSLLQAAINTYQPVDVQGAITGAQKIKSNESLLAQQQQQTEMGALKLGAIKEELPLETALLREQKKTSLLGNAIATATDADSWDTHMRALSQEVPEAAQYIGRYTPVLQSRLLGVYSGKQAEAEGGGAGLEQPTAGGKGAAAGGPASGALDYQFAQTTPEQRSAMLDKLTKFTTALEQVGDQATWDKMRGQLHAEGIPMMDQLGDYSAVKAASVYKKVQPILSYLQNRAISDQAGIPEARPAPDIKVAGNSVFAIDPFAGTARKIGSDDSFAAAPGTDADGNPVIYNKQTGKRVGGDGSFGFEDFADRMIPTEKGADRTAKNPRSSATGDGQFTDSTWLQTVKTARPELAAAMNDKQLLELRKDPAMAREMVAINAENNANFLSTNGESVNATSLALAHRFGPAGALSVLHAAPNTPLSSVLSADAIKANPGLAKETAGSYVKDLAGKVGLDVIGAKSAAAPEPVDPNSQSILAQTGLSLPGFMALTGDSSKLPRDKASRNRAFKEAEAFANARGVDASTLASQYKAYNETLESNIKRVNNTKIMEGELAGTIDNLKPVADAAGMGRLRVGNLAKQFAEGEFNDPTMQQYAFQLNQLRAELAGYNGALQGRTGASLTENDYHEAERVIKNGLDSGAADGLLKSVHSATEKMRGVLESSVDNSRKAVWDLFGVGGKFKPQYKVSKATASPSGMDQQALAWANANPKDPRAAKIRQKLGQ